MIAKAWRIGLLASIGSLGSADLSFLVLKAFAKDVDEETGRLSATSLSAKTNDTVQP